MAERCDVTDLLVVECAHCRGIPSAEEQAAAERRELLATGRWIAAQYPGDCASCGQHFAAGTAIRTSPNGWLAECCAEASDG